MRATKLTFILITSILMLICVYGCKNPLVPLGVAGNTIFIKGKDNAPMVWIEAGKFEMGSHSDEFQNFPVNKNELPEHTVYLDAFYIDVYEVTNAQYKKFLEDNPKREKPAYWGDSWKSVFGAPNKPVVGVDWFDAAAYAEWVGKRLPTEAEWEKAARGGLVGTHFPWLGDEISYDDANFEGAANLSIDVWEKTSPVGSFDPNGYGLYDMVGNVAEWVADWYGSDYYEDPLVSYIPWGPEFGLYRVMRGGGWNDIPLHLRVAHRFYDSPLSRNWTVGFRCAVSAAPSLPPLDNL